MIGSAVAEGASPARERAAICTSSSLPGGGAGGGVGCAGFFFRHEAFWSRLLLPQVVSTSLIVVGPTAACAVGVTDSALSATFPAGTMSDWAVALVESGLSGTLVAGRAVGFPDALFCNPVIADAVSCVSGIADSDLSDIFVVGTACASSRIPAALRSSLAKPIPSCLAGVASTLSSGCACLFRFWGSAASAPLSASTIAEPFALPADPGGPSSSRASNFVLPATGTACPIPPLASNLVSASDGPTHNRSAPTASPPLTLPVLAAWRGDWTFVFTPLPPVPAFCSGSEGALPLEAALSESLYSESELAAPPPSWLAAPPASATTFVPDAPSSTSWELSASISTSGKCIERYSSPPLGYGSGDVRKLT
mmetsp:Transcript_41171/g.113529  ORF Transcript_41171/g.113529 Transcript_41171/m.113529 type:complete len:367 (-) Transcript_41171:1129-2229(-)